MEFIKTEHIDLIMKIVIDRQTALNALNSEILLELSETFKSIDTQKTRCVIITGAGEKAFVAGADIGQMKTMNQAQAKDFSIKGNEIFYQIEMFPIPVIAAVNGYALGGGCELALACDIRIASENAFFGQPEVCLGILPGFGGSFRLVHIVGEGMAKEMLYTGERISAARAYEMGIVNAVYPLHDLQIKAIELAKKICKNSPIGISSLKNAINESKKSEVAKKIDIEARYFSKCFETEDQMEAMAAMLEKRQAKPFIGK